MPAPGKQTGVVLSCPNLQTSFGLAIHKYKKIISNSYTDHEM